MFCANCDLIFRQSISYRPWPVGDDPLEDTWTAEHNYTIPYQDLLTTAEECHCCHQILRESESHLHSTVPPERKLHVSMKLHFKQDIWGVLDISVNFRKKNSCRKNSRKNQPRKNQSRNNKFLGSFELSILRRKVDTSSEGGQGWLCNSQKMPATGHFPADNTGSDYTAGFVKKCLEHCRSHHPSCQIESTEVLWYPTRLVEVLEDNAVRVIETAETVPVGPYATLSHCWGESRMIMATTENIGRLKKHIAILDLPKTFSDALQFIKAIGISLIWIDSLCIIQDSDQDWAFESRTMLQVYQHAECNLTAAVAEDSRGGLFSQRNHRNLPSGWYQFDTNIPELQGDFCAVPGAFFKDEFEEQIGSSRLMSRGWVFQERAASRRVIAFGRDQVFWDCSEVMESDILPGYPIRLYQYLDNNLYPQLRMGMAVPKHLSPGVPQSFNSFDEGLVAWQFLVRRYSACAFTFNKDRPVAMLGVAQMMSNALNAQPAAISTAYWAGLWLQDMYRQLAWNVAHTGVRKNHHAPSWSWLSIDGPVEWDSQEMEPEIYGLTVSALATIAGPGPELMKNNFTFCEITADLKIWCNLHTFHVREAFAFLSAAEAPCTPYLKLDYEDIEVDTLYLLPLTYCHSKYGYEESSEGGVTGILVQPAGNVPGTYKRCGRVMIYPSKPEHVEEYLKLPGGEKHARVRRTLHLLGEQLSVTDFAYEEYDSELGYLIRLI